MDVTTLSAHEQRLIAQETNLPGLSALLDNRLLLSLLQQTPAFRHAREITCHYLRYKPGTSCIISAEITMSDGQRQWCIARALPPQRFAISWANPKRQAMVAEGHPWAPLALPEQSILILHPTQDRDIRFIPWLWESKKLHHRLCQRGYDLNNAPEDNWKILRFKPGRRCVAAITHQGKVKNIIRFYSKQEFGAALCGQAVGSALGHIQAPVALAEQRILLARFIAGDALDSLLGISEEDNLAKMAGETLAAIHDSNFSLPAIRSSQHDIRQLWRVLETLGAIAPELVDQYRQCAQRIENTLPQFEQPAVVLHGDFSADQVIVSADKSTISVIDWDSCAYGHPLNDVASFLAQLEFDVLSKKISPQMADRTTHAFISGYFAPRKCSNAGLKMYTARALLCLAMEPFRHRMPAWPAMTHAVIQRAAELSECTPVTPALSWQEQLLRLCSPEKMLSPLQSALNLPEGTTLDACLLLRHKTDRRALVEYRFSPAPANPILAKFRKKGVDKHGYACQLLLWQTGFDASQNIHVPQPLALLSHERLWLQSKVDATLLTDRLASGLADDASARVADTVGNALAKLQRHAPLQASLSQRLWTLQDELDVIHKGFIAHAHHHPAQSLQLTAIFEQCKLLVGKIKNARTGTLHRDFYPDQILVDSRDATRLTLLDFDLCCRGALALDAGNYLAHIRELALRLHNDAHAFHHHETHFLKSWLACTPESNEQEVQRFLALSLVRHIFISARFAERKHTTSFLLNYCEQLLRTS